MWHNIRQKIPFVNSKFDESANFSKGIDKSGGL